MSMLDRTINQARRRLNLNMWLGQVTTGALVAAGLAALLLLAERTLGLGLPEGLGLAAAGSAGLLTALVLGIISTIDRPSAAVTLDRAARLKERLSSALAVRSQPDGFARAVVLDAEQVAGKTTPAAHLPMAAPAHWPWSAAACTAALLLYWLMPTLNLLAAAQGDGSDTANPQEQIEAQTVKATLNERLDRVRDMAAESPRLADLARDMEKINIPDRATITPEDVQREALKKIDSIQEKLDRERNADDMSAFRELQRQLTRLDPPKSNDDTSKLAQALAAADMRAAKEALRELQKKLESLDPNSSEEAKQIAEMGEKLNELSEKLDQLAKQPAVEKELANKGGLSEEQARELLEKLKGLDPQQMQQQLQQALQNSGMTQQQMQEMARNIQQQQQAQQQMQQLAQAMQMAAQALQQCQNSDGAQGNQGQMSAADAMAMAMQSMQAAMGQMSDLEMSEQAMGSLEAALNELRQMRENVCRGGECKGGDCPGCGQCKGNGGQGPNAGIGYGSRIGREKSSHQYEATRARVQLRDGEIIGQMLIDGPQIRGEATAEAREALSAALRDATDAIERNQHPRQYDTAVRMYFDRLAGLLKTEPNTSAAPQPAPADPDDD